jgi:hypothetical protein
MNQETIGTIVRFGLKFLGGFLVSKGLADDSAVTWLLGGSTAITSFVWGIYQARVAAAHREIATTTPHTP